MLPILTGSKRVTEQTFTHLAEDNRIFKTVPWEKNMESNTMMQTAAALFGLAALGGLLMAGMRLNGIRYRYR